MNKILHKLIHHEHLDRQSAREALILIAEGKANNSQMAAFITVFLMRSITVDELSGFRDAMLDLCQKISVDTDCMDVCGTGGDGKNTFNISTTSAFVIAGAGQKVVKHGNYGVSSICGSSNLLQALGYNFTNDENMLLKQLDKAGICFLHAPLFHPAMKAVAPVRKELGMKTFFNMLGPLVNPGEPNKQLTGVFSNELARVYQYLLQQEGKQFGLVHSLDGYDEISLTSTFRLITYQGECTLHPEALPYGTIRDEDLSGGETIEESKEIFINVLYNRGTAAQMAVVKANAGAALMVAGIAEDLAEGIQKADESIASGRALQAFELLINTQ
ncbi:MAG: anthranilate phosphoribosyltransferase [Flavobacteriales bacterium]